MNTIIKAAVVGIHRLDNGKIGKILGYDVKLTDADGRVILVEYVHIDCALSHADYFYNASKATNSRTLILRAPNRDNNTNARVLRVDEYAENGIKVTKHALIPFDKFKNYLDKYVFECKINDYKVSKDTYRLNYDRPIGVILDNRDNIVGLQVRTLHHGVLNLRKEEAFNYLKNEHKNTTSTIGCSEDLVKENRAGAKYNQGLGKLIPVVRVDTVLFDAYAASKTFDNPPIIANGNFLNTRDEFTKDKISEIGNSINETSNAIDRGTYHIDIDIKNIKGYYQVYVDRYASGFNEESNIVLIYTKGKWMFIKERLLNGVPKLKNKFYVSNIPFYIDSINGYTVIRKQHNGVSRFWL